VVLAPASQRDAEHAERGQVEALARREILHYELQVVDQPAAIKLVGFHT
jgi:hypothetical protein